MSNPKAGVRGRSERDESEPQVLRPFDRRETCTTEEAALRAGRGQRTIRNWVEQFSIGRRIAKGPIAVSRVALEMLLDGDHDVLAAYLRGDRDGPTVVEYFDRLGLGDLVRLWRRTM